MVSLKERIGGKVDQFTGIAQAKSRALEVLGEGETLTRQQIIARINALHPPRHPWERSVRPGALDMALDRLQLDGKIEQERIIRSSGSDIDHPPLVFIYRRVPQEATPTPSQ